MKKTSWSIALRAIDEMSRPFQKVGNMSDKMSGKLRSMRKELKELERAQNGVSGSIGTTTARMEKLSKAISKIEKANKNYEKTMKRAANISLVAGGVGSVGRGMLDLISNPLDQMRGVERSKGELASLGMTNIGAVVAEGRRISGQLAGMNTAAFVSAAYDIKSGIASLTDEGVAAMTSMAAKTARATKAEIEQMTSLFATGYGSFKESLYKNLSDEAFGEVFSAGLAASVKQFKTDGSKMQQAIQSMGSGLAAAGVSLEDQLTGLGMLQQKMEAGVAGTTLAALERTAAQAQERFAKMGVYVDTLDEKGNLRNLADLLETMQQTFGDTYTSEVGAQIQQAFGSDEAVKFFKALWGQQEQFRKNSEMLADAQRQGVAFTEAMARAIDNNMDARLQIVMQKFGSVFELVGYSLVPALEQLIPVLEVAASFLGGFVERQPGFTAAVTSIIAVLGGVAVAVSPFLVGFAALSVAMSKLSLQSKVSAAEMALSGGGGFLGKLGKVGKLGKLGKWGAWSPPRSAP